MRISISVMPISLPKPMFDHLLESSHRDDSNKWSNRIWYVYDTLTISLEKDDERLPKHFYS